MNHEPYRTWLLQETALAPQQQEALAAHLAACPPCRALARGWEAARQALATWPEVAPPPGFLARWQSYREARLQRRALAWALALALAGVGALGLLGVLGLPAWLGSLSVWGLMLVGDFVLRLARWQAAWAMARAVAGLLPAPVWLALLGGALLGGWLWVGVGASLLCRTLPEGALRWCARQRVRQT